ncbi:MAG: inositol monophosphatase [Ignavibacteriae bacterium HGW-Ignavibacteriae-1]|jgi:myo-inositol-1(or 4)-monophosphatase|nr:MAG: inositol monophosphatase [Ignavibacteriae bacterium HGW-Ignavibacteriae-1]
MLELLEKCAIEAALKAGAILKEGFGSTFEIKNKTGINNLVTEYDFKAENAIIETIKSYFPEHKFLAEETGDTGKEDSDYQWVIDPLDGTVNFAHAVPVFCVSIAVRKGKDVLCGVIYHPLLDELFVAVNGGGAYLNGKTISISDSDDMKTSLLVTGFPYNVNENPHNCVDTFVGIVQSGIPIRRLGSAALDLAYVAAGRFDGFWESSLFPWDMAAGYLLVKEAGGKITQYNGDEFWLDSPTILATNGLIHDQILKSINYSKK